jgi:hypothetical protein
LSQSQLMMIHPLSSAQFASITSSQNISNPSHAAQMVASA